MKLRRTKAVMQMGATALVAAVVAFGGTSLILGHKNVPQVIDATLTSSPVCVGPNFCIFSPSPGPVLYPGVTTPSNLTLNLLNPLTSPINVSSITVSFTNSFPTVPPAPACNYADLTLNGTHASYLGAPISDPGAVLIPSSLTLPAGTISGPSSTNYPVTLSLVDHGNQDSCEGLTLTMNYAATGTTNGPGSAYAEVQGVENDLGQQLGSLAFTNQTSGVTTNLNATDAVDNTHVWAVGDNCTVLFSGDGLTWAKDTHVTGCTSGTKLTGVFVQGGAGPGWIVGQGGTVLVCTSACNTVTAVWAPLTAGSIVGANDGTLTVATKAAQSNSLFASAAYVNYKITDSLGKIPANTTITAINTTSKTATLSLTPTAATTKDTFTVTAPATVLPAGTVNFTSIWAADPNHVYAVGTDTSTGNGVIWACSANCNQTMTIPVPAPSPPAPPPPPPAPPAPPGNVASWTNVSRTGLSALNGVAGAGGGLTIAVGASGTVLICTVATCSTASTGWTQLTQGSGGSLPGSGVTFQSVWAANANHVYAVGSAGGQGVIWSCSNNCNQTSTSAASVPSPPAVAPAPPPPPPPGNGAQWAILPLSATGPTTFYSVTGQGPNTAWATGTGGSIWFCPQNCTTEPTGWVAVSPPHPTSNTLYGATSSDPNHFWAVGAAGTIVAFTNPAGPPPAGPSVNAIEMAIGDLGVALNPTLWVDGNDLVTTPGPPGPPPGPAGPGPGNQVFQQVQQAIQQMMTITTTVTPPPPPPPPPPPGNPTWDTTDMTNLDQAMRIVATTEIAKVPTPVCAKRLPQYNMANTEVSNGDTAVSQGHYDQAVAPHYQNAWQDALQAIGTAC